MAYQNILFDISDAIATITLNRPDKLNSFTEEMHADLRDAVQRVRDDQSVRALLITGAGRGFCAGQDLNERVMSGEVRSVDVGSTLERNYNPLIKGLQALPIPIVCAVNGVAAGAGCSFALAADIVIAARSARFMEVFTRIGLLPDAGGTYVLPRLIGQARAMAVSLLAEPITAEQAEAWGLIWKCVDDDQFAAEARRLAATLAAGPTKAYALTKRAIYASSANSLDKQLALEAELQREAGRSEDFKEGVRAFMEKRAAKFVGR
ncbi:MAG TPA: 2-(1,2-epoxy-1,2-dihydrophenyl)acetyl-CoA isomerase PaaG [Burkholderiales bacterium]|nr:2-(1,2-epoxy-1,2-dihydrophenyl)acetyl-CoA isomerase PaaG [Burkholderiales bacterium]